MSSHPERSEGSLLGGRPGENDGILRRSLVAPLLRMTTWGFALLGMTTWGFALLGMTTWGFALLGMSTWGSRLPR